MFDFQPDYDGAIHSRHPDEPWRIDEILPLVLAALPVDEPILNGSRRMPLFEMESAEPSDALGGMPTLAWA